MSNEFSTTLPHNPVTFRKPPVVEVALGVQLTEDVVDLEVLSSFTALVRSEFPKREQQPPLPPMEEDFSATVGAPAIRFQVQQQFAIPRTWFIGADDVMLLQVQGNRFVLNWRKRQASQPYPRYWNLMETFENRVKQLLDCIEQANGHQPEINYCEVSYFNHIDVPGSTPGGAHPDLSAVLAVLQPLTGKGPLPAAEDAQFHTRYRMNQPNRPDPMGRLYVSVTPAYRDSDQLPIYVMTLSTHTLPARGDLEAAKEVMSIGRNWIVQGFRDLTTKKMHDVWELTAEGEEG